MKELGIIIGFATLAVLIAVGAILVGLPPAVVPLIIMVLIVVGLVIIKGKKK